jgi:hypothetical protein
MGVSWSGSASGEVEGCGGGCQCTGWSTWLAVDASHLYLLRRLAATQGSDPEAAMSGLIACHQCAGDRGLLTTGDCLAKEIIQKSELVGELLPATVRSWFKVVSDEGFAELPGKAPDTNRDFGERDRRLAAAAHGQSQFQDTSVWLVSDDEDFLANLAEVPDLVEARPIHSCDLMLELARCGALEYSVIEKMVEIEGERITLKDMGGFKRARKLDRLDRLTSELAVLDWRRHFD